MILLMGVTTVAMTAGCTITVKHSPTETSVSATTSAVPSATAPTAPPSITLARYNYQFNDPLTGTPTPSQRSATPRVLVVRMVNPDLAPSKPPPDASFALVFPLLPRPVACIQRVELQLLLLDGQGTGAQNPAATLVAYPSGLLSLAHGHYPSDPIWSSDFLVDKRPATFVDVGKTPGWVTFDITELYATWAQGGPFPNGRTIPSGTPLVVKIRPDTWALGPSFTRRFAALSAGPANAPRLRWTAKRDC
jgi:hypothetical protein